MYLRVPMLARKARESLEIPTQKLPEFYKAPTYVFCCSSRDHKAYERVGPIFLKTQANFVKPDEGVKRKR